jgi:hypothetical protein
MPNNVQLKEFAAHAVIREIGEQLTPAGLDAAMLITIALKEALQHYHKYGAELSRMQISDESVLKRLSKKQASELRYSDGKRRMVMKQADEVFVALKLQTAEFIGIIERNIAQMESAKPEAELKLHNLQRQGQGFKPVKRITKKTNPSK